MSTIAQMLKRAREEQNLTVHQVAEVTKIKTDHIRALEAGDYDSFSAPVYIRGFVRAYALMLKIDRAQVSTVLEAELAQTKKFAEPPRLVGEAAGIFDPLFFHLSKVSWRMAWLVVFALAGLLVLLLGYRGLHRRANHDPLADLKVRLYEPAQKEPGLLLDLPSGPSHP